MASDTLNEAIAFIKAGKKAEAQKLLEPFIEANPQNITAWIWEAETWPNIADKIKVMEMCLRHNPNSTQVQQALTLLRSKLAQSQSPTSSPKLEPQARAQAPLVPPASSQPPKSAPELPQPSPHPQPVIAQPTIAVVPPRPWYRTPVVYILTFLFLTPVWTLLILTDRQQKWPVKGLAGVIALGYCYLCTVGIFPILQMSNQSAAKENVKIDTFGCNMTAFSPYDGNFYGKVSNTGDRSLRFVELRGIIKDKAGKVVGTNTGFTSSDTLLPGAASEFSFFVKYPFLEGEDCFILVESASFN